MDSLAFLSETVVPCEEQSVATRSVQHEGWRETMTRVRCRLDAAFETLNAHGIIALQNAGYTMSDGLTEGAEALHRRGRNNLQGYCFYHGQDLERAVKGEGLMLAFGSLDDDKAHKLAVGQRIREVLERGGFTVQWNGDPETRLNLPDLDWKRRGPTA